MFYSSKLLTLNKIIRSIRIVKSIDIEYKHDVESMIYAFADKFLQGKDLEKVKEELNVTELGRMLVEDGIKKGKAELLIKQLIKKFKKLPDEYQKNIKELSPESLEIIATDIFELESVEELKRYF